MRGRVTPMRQTLSVRSFPVKFLELVRVSWCHIPVRLTLTMNLQSDLNNRVQLQITPTHMLATLVEYRHKQYELLHDANRLNYVNRF